MERIHKLILKTLTEKGISDEDNYDRKLSRTELTSELIGKGQDKETIDTAIEQLCGDGTLTADEQDIYLYDEPPAANS